MGILTEDMFCDICGTKESVGFNPSNCRLKDGYICRFCKHKLYGYTVEQMNQMTIEEATKIIQDEEVFANTYIKKYHVEYRGGYPDHNQIGFSLISLYLYHSFLRIRATCFEKEFKPILIEYKDILSVQLIESPVLLKGVGYLENKIILQIEYYYGDSIFKLLLDSITFTKKRGEIDYSEIINFFSSGEGSKQLRKRPKEDTVSIPDEILKYKNLLNMGAITQEEYDKFKKSLLDTL